MREESARQRACPRARWPVQTLSQYNTWTCSPTEWYSYLHVNHKTYTHVVMVIKQAIDYTHVAMVIKPAMDYICSNMVIKQAMDYTCGNGHQTDNVLHMW